MAPRYLALWALCASWAARGAVAANAGTRAGLAGVPGEAWEEDEACPASTGPAVCTLSLRQLRAGGAAALEPVRAPVQPLQEAVPLEAEEVPPAEDAGSLPERSGEAASAAKSAGVVPGGWGEAANYTDAVVVEEENQRTAMYLASCAQYGCTHRYHRSHYCQCNSQCGHYGNCCGDYWSRCAHPNPPAPDPAPAPAPASSGEHRVLTLYHQTSPRACQLIIQSNFRPGTRGWCGGGIYFATSPAATNTKAIGPDSHKGCILQAEVDVGHVKYMSRTCDRQLTGQKVWAQHFDSVSFDPGDGQEFIVYSSNRVSNIRMYR